MSPASAKRVFAEAEPDAFENRRIEHPRTLSRFDVVYDFSINMIS
jgi:hypothetical protein